MSEALSRTSVLASRHRDLGSGLEDWNGMGTAWSYTTNADDEHDAIREKAGIFDMSPLKKVLISGSDAAAVLDHLTSRDMNRVAPGQAAYLSVLTDQGTMADDAIVYNKGDDNWMIVHGSGDTMNLLADSARNKSASVQFTDELHNISIQGPDSLTYLQSVSDTDLTTLAYFQHKPARLFGHPCLISRTGYSGERGYEIFVDHSTACAIWDGLVDAGVMPCSFAALDKVRIEAGLLFYGYDMTEEHTPYEVGLGFTVTQSKSGYRGQAALQAAKGQEKINTVCLDINHQDMLNGGEMLSVEGQTVGVVNSPCYSHRLDKSLALAHVTPQSAMPNTLLTVSGDGFSCSAKVVSAPVYDPEKKRTHQA